MPKDKEFKKIEELSLALGMDKDEEKTVFEILESDDKNQKKLALKSGSWSSTEPWFGVDKNSDVHIMVPVKSLISLIESYKKLAKENFDLRLEKSIMQEFPIDFSDVWIVCMDEVRKIALKNKNSRNIDINLDAIVKSVKDKHPNLFVNIDELIKGVNR